MTTLLDPLFSSLHFLKDPSSFQYFWLELLLGRCFFIFDGSSDLQLHYFYKTYLPYIRVIKRDDQTFLTLHLKDETSLFWSLIGGKLFVDDKLKRPASCPPLFWSSLVSHFVQYIYYGLLHQIHRTQFDLTRYRPDYFYSFRSICFKTDVIKRRIHLKEEKTGERICLMF